MAISAELKTKLNTKLTQLYVLIKEKQDDYAKWHNGRHWQGLITKANFPDGSADISSDSVWPNFKLPKLPFAIKITCYWNRTGYGWQATVYVKIDGNVYARSKGEGNESSFRNFNWQRVLIDKYGN